MPIRLAASVLLLSISCVAAAYDRLAPPDVDLSGRWSVNAALSDDADSLLAKRLEKQLQRERRWRDQEAREEGAEAPPPAEPLSKPQTGRVLAQLRRALELYSMVEIKQSDGGGMLEIRGDGGQRRFTAGDRSAMSMPEGQLADAEVGWDGSGFVIDRKVRKGPHVVERYQLLKKTGQLQVIISWGGASDELLLGVKIKRVFDRSTGPAPAPDPDVGPVR